MRLNDSRLRLVTVGALGAFALAVSTVDAHSLFRTQGQALIESDRVTVTLDVCPEDFTHLYGLLPGTDGTVALDSILTVAERHADDLTAVLQLWDERGDPITGEPFELSPRGPGPPWIPWMQLCAMRLRYTASYRLPSRCGFITFRMSPAEQNSAIGRQWVIEARASEGTTKQTVQLTSRGNAETVELQWPDRFPRLAPRRGIAEAAACEAFEDRGAARFQEVFVDINVSPGTILVRTSVPLPLLETWIPIPRAVEGRIDPAEQWELLAAARALMDNALVVEADRPVLRSGWPELRLLRAGTFSGPHSEPPVRIGFFTSRLETVQRFEAPDPQARWTVAWALLNNAVVFARVAVHVDGRCTPMEFTAYSSTLEWSLSEAAFTDPR